MEVTLETSKLLPMQLNGVGLVSDADIISLSLGGINDRYTQWSTVNAVKVALSKGVFVVAAAGNDGGSDDDGRVSTPSNVAEVITVGASMKGGSVWKGSSMGEPS